MVSKAPTCDSFMSSPLSDFGDLFLSISKVYDPRRDQPGEGSGRSTEVDQVHEPV